MGEEFGKRAKSWAYRYNQRNPTFNASFGVAHAAENWMMFKGTNTGYVLFICFLSIAFSSRLFNIHILVLMDRTLSLKWRQLKMRSLRNWLPIGSHSSVLATQINIDYRVHLSGLCTRVLHALFYNKAQALQQLWAVVSWRQNQKWIKLDVHS